MIRDWIDCDSFYELDMKKHLEEPARNRECVDHFFQKSCGVLDGVVGVIDGYLCMIGKPRGVPNPAGYFSRKGFFAVNLQVICDHKRRVIWVSKLNIGSAHDSPCFKNSGLNEYLQDNWEDLFRKGLFLLGDSAYSPRTFMCTPYDAVSPESKEDHYNFHHSSGRIIIECVFGEFVNRWALFNRKLLFGVKDAKCIIDGAFRLHNFLIDCREDAAESGNDQAASDNAVDLVSFRDEHMEELWLERNAMLGSLDYQEDSGRQQVGREPMGRPTRQFEDCKRLGLSMRDDFRDGFEREGMKRPARSAWRLV